MKEVIMGFSFTGFVMALIVLLPNLLMVIFPPRNAPAERKDARWIFTVLERIGQFGCLILLAVSKAHFENRAIDAWFILSALCIAIYYTLWIRYVAAGRDYAALFRFRAVPIPMAITPILAFIFIAIWGDPMGSASLRGCSRSAISRPVGERTVPFKAESVRGMNDFRAYAPAFEDGGLIPVEYTGYGADASPEIRLSNVSERARSIAVIMDDMGHPIPAYNHWVIWNLPAVCVIPKSIPCGKTVEGLPGAVQGRGYGKHRYRGPKPPFRWSHRYRFQVFALDCTLALPAESRKRDFMKEMEGHILQRAEFSGHYR